LHHLTVSFYVIKRIVQCPYWMDHLCSTPTVNEQEHKCYTLSQLLDHGCGTAFRPTYDSPTLPFSSSAGH